MNKWATVHNLYSASEPLANENIIAKFLSDGLAQEWAEAQNAKTPHVWWAVKRTYGTIYILPKPR